MAAAFPSNPQQNQTFVLGGKTYQYVGSRWRVVGTTQVVAATLAQLSCQPSTATQFLALPLGTTAQRVGNLQSGGTSVYTTATGLYAGTAFVHVFTASELFTVTSASLPISFLTVGGVDLVVLDKDLHR